MEPSTTETLSRELAAASYHERVQQLFKKASFATIQAWSLYPPSSCPLPNLCSGGSKARIIAQPWPGEHSLHCHLTLFQAVQASMVLAQYWRQSTSHRAVELLQLDAGQAPVSYKHS